MNRFSDLIAHAAAHPERRIMDLFAIEDRAAEFSAQFGDFVFD